ncbi:hypothetical protein D9M71_649590 [compost metagenome]
MQWGIDDPRSHAIDLYLRRRQFQRQGTYRLVQAALDQYRQQRRHLGIGLQGDGCGDGDDLPGAVLRHVPCGRLGGINEAFEVGVDDGLDVSRGVLGHRLGDEDAGIVDQHVDLAEGFNGLGEQSFSRLRLGNVAFHQEEVCRIAQFIRGVLQARQGAGVADYIVAALKVGFGDGETQAAGSAGDDDGFAGLHDRCLQKAGR